MLYTNGARDTAAEILAHYSKDLARTWQLDPWRRVDVAYAFAAGMVDNPEEDVHPTASLIIRLALLDRALRVMNSTRKDKIEI
jgi:hypothetical protein